MAKKQWQDIWPTISVTHPDSLSPVPGSLVSPDPGPGCWWPKMENLYSRKKI